jgi:hypothetical protein
METLKIKQGDSSPLYKITASKTPAGLSFLDDKDNWSCKQAITSKPGSNKITLGDPVLDATSTYFQCYLRPYDTETLEPGKYIWAVEISNTGANTVPQVRREILNIAIEILPQMV